MKRQTHTHTRVLALPPKGVAFACQSLSLGTGTSGPGKTAVHVPLPRVTLASSTVFCGKKTLRKKQKQWTPQPVGLKLTRAHSCHCVLKNSTRQQRWRWNYYTPTVAVTTMANKKNCKWCAKRNHTQKRYVWKCSSSFSLCETLAGKWTKAGRPATRQICFHLWRLLRLHHMKLNKKC